MKYTEHLESVLFELWDEDYASEEKVVEFLNSANEFSTFGEALSRFICSHTAAETSEEAYAYLKEQFKNKKIDINRNTLKNWFESGKRPKKGEQSREHMYKICFAMDLSVEDTAELFRKVYFDRPFNIRDKKEFIYYYCLYKGLTHQDAEYLLSQSSTENESADNDDTISTRVITADSINFKDDKELLDYINDHPHNFSIRNISGKEILENLIDEVKAKDGDKEKLKERDSSVSWAIITQECNRNPEMLAKYKSISSISAMVDIILDVDLVKERAERDDSIFKNSNLPSEIRQCFPDKHTFSSKEPTFEEIRKMIILLFSYKFWFYKDYNYQEADLDDYIMQLDGLLQEANQPQLYYGNPYDWLFMYCTICENSLDMFRGIMAEVLIGED